MRILSLFSLVFIGVQMIAQTAGVVSGKVTEEGSEGFIAIPYATIVVLETNDVANTELDGSYQIPLTPGEYTLNITYLGYKDINKKVVVTESGLVLDLEMSQAAAELEAVQVVAKVNKESDNVLMLDRKNATAMVQKVGAAKLSAIGASNAQEGLLKVTGVAKNSGGSSGSIFVRGLGDRYNNVTLNGFTVPSTNPDTKTPPLEIFPTDVISNLAVSKVYSARYAGDFAGANINIKTKSTSTKEKLKVGLSIGANSQVTGKNIKTYEGGAIDFIGFDNARKVDGNMTKQNEYKWSKMNNKFSQKTETAIPNIGLSVGYNSYFKHDAFDLGVSAFVSFDNKYSLNDFKATSFRTNGSFINNFQGTAQKYTTQLSSLASVSFDFREGNILEYTSMYINTSSDEVRAATGTINSSDYSGLFMSNMFQEYQQTSLLMNQMVYKVEQDVYDYKIGYTHFYTLSGMPDRRRLRSYKKEGANRFVIDQLNPGVSRYFMDMSDNEHAVLGNFKWYYDKENSKDGIVVGVNGRFKTREQNFSNITLDFVSYYQLGNPDAVGTYSTSDDFLNNLDRYITDAYDRGLVSLSDAAQSGIKKQDYDLTILAAYINQDYKLFDVLNTSVGVRLEKINQGTDYVTNGTKRSPKIDELKVLPSVSLKYQINASQAIKLAGSKTYSMPQFRELNQIPYDTEIGQVIGNNKLEPSDIYNIDLGYEWFFARGNLFSVTSFYKFIDKPIEQVFINLDAQTSSVVNTKEATVYGVEGELEIALKNFTENAYVSPFTVSLNGSWLHTEAIASEETVHKGLGNTSIRLYNLTHDLQGATPLLVNLDLKHNLKFEGAKSTAALAYNYASKTVSQLGGFNGDIILDPIATLNFKWSLKLDSGLSFGLSAKNLLNPDFIYKQEIKQTKQDREVNSFKRGVDFGVSLSYDF